MKSIVPVMLIAILSSGSNVWASTSSSERAVSSSAQVDSPVPGTKGAPLKASAPDAMTMSGDPLELLFGHRSNDLETRSGPAGMKVLDLQGRFSTVSILVRNPDGTLRRVCVDNIGAARKLLAGADRVQKPTVATQPPLQ